MTAAPPRRRSRHRALAGSRVLVTGGSSGLGAALARDFARHGCRVLATARRADRLEILARENPGIEVVAGDLTTAAFRDRLVSDASARLGGLDIVVAAAGSGAIGPFPEGRADTFGRIVDVDLLAPAELIRTSLPLLRLSADPAIVLVGSILGLHPLPLHAEYCAAKAALRSLAGSLRVELAAEDVQVLLVNLGPIVSEFWDNLLVGSRPRWSRGRPMAADRAAQAIVAGVVRRKAEVTPGWQAKGFAIAARFLPGLIDTIVARHCRTVEPATSTSTP